MASDWEGGWLEVGGLGDSAASPFGRTPSANHTLRCSRDMDPKSEKKKKFRFAKKQCMEVQSILLLQCGAVPSLPDCFRTPTGTITVGGGELSTPDASACCRGGMVEQYSAGLLGFGLWLLAGAGVSHD